MTAATKKPARGPVKKPAKAPAKPAPKAASKQPKAKKAETTGGKKEPTAAPKADAKKEQGSKLSIIRIRLSAFDHTVLDEAAMKILETAERSGAIVHGPIPLPTHIRKFTVNRATFVKKDARDQFEMRIHRRLIDLSETTFKTVESLQGLGVACGVVIEIKIG